MRQPPISRDPEAEHEVQSEAQEIGEGEEGGGMIIELSDEELAIIDGWYSSAAGESASGLSVGMLENFVEEYKYSWHEQMEVAKRVKALVDKLGFEYASGDAYSMKANGILDENWKPRDDEDQDEESTHA